MKAEVAYFPAGEIPHGKPGSVFLTSSDAWISKAIQFSQQYGPGVSYTESESRWNHCGLVLEDGSICHSLWYGPQRDDFARYTDSVVAVISPVYSFEDLAQVLDFAEHALEADWGYAYLIYTGLILNVLTGLRVGVSGGTSRICSALVGDALCRAGAVWPVNPGWLLPADIAKFFKL